MKIKRRQAIRTAVRTLGARLALLTVVIASTAALGQKVSMDYDKGADFSAFKTYAWAPGTPAANPVANEYIISAIDQGLAEKGLHLVKDSHEADLVISYHAVVDSAFNVSGFLDPTYATTNNIAPVGSTTMWSTGSPMGATSRLIQKGTLALQMFDAKRHGLVWMASAKAKLNENRSQRISQLDQALTWIIDSYPPKKNGAGK